MLTTISCSQSRWSRVPTGIFTLAVSGCPCLTHAADPRALRRGGKRPEEKAPVDAKGGGKAVVPPPLPPPIVPAPMPPPAAGSFGARGPLQPPSTAIPPFGAPLPAAGAPARQKPFALSEFDWVRTVGMGTYGALRLRLSSFQAEARVVELARAQPWPPECRTQRAFRDAAAITRREGRKASFPPEKRQMQRAMTHASAPTAPPSARAGRVGLVCHRPTGARAPARPDPLARGRSALRRVSLPHRRRPAGQPFPFLTPPPPFPANPSRLDVRPQVPRPEQTRGGRAARGAPRPSLAHPQLNAAGASFPPFLPPPRHHTAAIRCRRAASRRTSLSRRGAPPPPPPGGEAREGRSGAHHHALCRPHGLLLQGAPARAPRPAAPPTAPVPAPPPSPLPPAPSPRLLLHCNSELALSAHTFILTLPPGHPRTPAASTSSSSSAPAARSSASWSGRRARATPKRTAPPPTPPPTPPSSNTSSSAAPPHARSPAPGSAPPTRGSSSRAPRRPSGRSTPSASRTGTSNPKTASWGPTGASRDACVLRLDFHIFPASLSARACAALCGVGGADGGVRVSARFMRIADMGFARPAPAEDSCSTQARTQDNPTYFPRRPPHASHSP